MNLYPTVDRIRSHHLGPMYGDGHSLEWAAASINHGLVNRREANHHVVKLFDQNKVVNGLDTITMPGNHLQLHIVTEKTRIPAYCTYLGTPLYTSADGAPSSIPYALSLEMRRK